MSVDCRDYTFLRTHQSYVNYCNKKGHSFNVPDEYVENGTIGDIGVLCGNEANSSAVYVAKSTACAHLKSNNRPIWGMMMFNNAFLKFDQVGFQQILFVGVLFFCNKRFMK